MEHILQMFTKRKLVAALCLMALFFSALGCNFFDHIPGAQTEKPRPADTQAPPTPAPVLPVQTQVSSAIETVTSGGPITLEFTEAQLNELASQELAGYDQVQDLHITLGSGTMQVSGKALQSGMSLPLTINLKVNVDAQGRPHAEILSGKAGPFPLPQSILDEVSVQVDQLIQDQLDSTRYNLFVDSVLIENGKLTIAAHTK